MRLWLRRTKRRTTSINTTFIYALCEPGTRTIRYIGKSDDPLRRFKIHLRDGGVNHKTNWIKVLLSAGQKPDLLILKEVLVIDWEDWERCYIRNAKMLGFDLTNGTDGGDGNCSFSVEIKNKISAALRGNKNSVGHQNFLGYRHTVESLEAIGAASRRREGEKRPGSTSKFLGVFWFAPRNRWGASISVGGHQFKLGRYTSEIDAAIAHDWVAALYGQKLNFPEKGSH